MRSTTCFILCTLLSPLAVSQASDQHPGVDQRAPAPITGDRHFVTGYPALNSDGSINVVVENPAGSNDKWEVEPASGVLRWEMGVRGLKQVSYLAYPANYGMVPGTLVARSLGGDAEPLDALVLGPALPRGTVVQGRLIGLLALLDRDEQDDKLLVVLDGAPMGEVQDLAQLRSSYPGVLEILETWFTHYKGDEVRSAGFLGRHAAHRLVDAAAHAYATTE